MTLKQKLLDLAYEMQAAAAYRFLETSAVGEFGENDFLLNDFADELEELAQEME